MNTQQIQILYTHNTRYIIYILRVNEIVVVDGAIFEMFLEQAKIVLLYLLILTLFILVDSFDVMDGVV